MSNGKEEATVHNDVQGERHTDQDAERPAYKGRQGHHVLRDDQISVKPSGQHDSIAIHGKSARQEGRDADKHAGRDTQEKLCQRRRPFTVLAAHCTHQIRIAGGANQAQTQAHAIKDRLLRQRSQPYRRKRSGNEGTHRMGQDVEVRP